MSSSGWVIIQMLPIGCEHLSIAGAEELGQPTAMRRRNQLVRAASDHAAADPMGTDLLELVSEVKGLYGPGKP